MKKIEDYTVKEIERLDEIQRVLTQYNARVYKDKSAVRDMPVLTDQEVMANSRYRELVMAEQLREAAQKE
jgi:hypothetical protein